MNITNESIIELKIPNDPQVMAAVAAWLTPVCDVGSVPNADIVGQLTANLMDGGITAEPVTTGLPDLDSVGLPWDARIHSGSRALNKTGEWKNKRGVSAELVAEIEKEMRGNNSVTRPIAEPIAEPIVAEAPATATATAPATAPAPALAPEPVVAVTFVDIAVLVNQCIATGKVATDGLDAIVAPFGVATFGELGSNPDYAVHFPAIKAVLEGLIQ